MGNEGMRDEGTTDSSASRPVQHRWLLRFEALALAALVAVVLLLGRVPGLHAPPSTESLLILGPLALAVFVGIMLLVMSGPLRAAWVALRGGSEGAPAAEQGRTGDEGDGDSEQAS